MKKALFHMLCLLLVLLEVPFPSNGQQAPDTSLLRSPVFREKLMLTTDRALYAAGDRILFRIFNFSDQLLRENQWSMVLYLELISDHQAAVARGKFIFGPKGASGQLIIPDTVTSGNYTLRAYTRWMRNFTAGAFASLPLGVVNSRHMGSFRKPAGDPPDTETTGLGISCGPERTLYRKREQVTVRIQRNGTSISPEGYAVSVARKAYINSGQEGLSGPGRATIGDNGSVAYAPETRGISVSGKVVRREERTPVPFARVHVTLLGEEPDYFETAADQLGGVSFCVPPRPGVSNALIAFDRDQGASLELVLEEAFSTDFTSTSVPKTDFQQQLPEAIRELVMISQLREAFDLRMQREPLQVDSVHRSFFYGTPEYRYRTADYVALPNLGEFFYELVPQVSVQRYKGQRILSVMDDAGFFLEYTPLVLLDHVAIQDMETLLSIDPALLETIDVVNTIYIRGSNTYGGIISLISKEGNLAGAGLPEGATIIELQTIEGQSDPLPQEVALPSHGDRLPDLRTTLFWDPEVHLTSGEENRLKFRASDIPGTYAVTVTGVTPEGKVIRSTCEFDVE